MKEQERREENKVKIIIHKITCYDGAEILSTNNGINPGDLYVTKILKARFAH